jgi:5-methyltetrahydropteroyltriglutamate--homocysteine methyltransferase
MNVGAYLLEMCTPRAGGLDVLRGLPHHARIGIGVVNQKHAQTEGPDDVEGRIARAVDLPGADRVLPHPDCGFATFADIPICSAGPAEAKLAVIARAAAAVRDRIHAR